MYTVQCTLYSMYTLGIKRGSFTDFRHYFFHESDSFTPTIHCLTHFHVLPEIEGFEDISWYF